MTFRRMIHLAAAFLAVAGLGRLPLSAQTLAGLTAENLRDACDNLVLAVRGIRPISQEDPGAMLCLGYLAGWNQAMEMVAEKPYCLPDVATMQPGDLADLVVTYIDGHPDLAAAPAHEALIETFSDAFPCPDEDAAGAEGESE